MTTPSASPPCPPCRLCAAPLARVFLDLGMSPISNAYLRVEDAHAMEPFYPLRVYVCDGCGLVQLPEAQRREEIFGGEYLYFSSYSDSWLAHCERYAATMTERLGLGADHLVVELASNDGYLLQYFKKRGIRVHGVDPAANVAKVAVEKGVPTTVAFFGAEVAKRLVAAEGQAALVAANNVLAHVPNLHDFVEGIRIVLAPGGTATIEFPHLLRLVAENQFDTIYHEHYSYLSLETARKALRAHALDVFDVDTLSTHGGSLRLHIRHEGDGSKPDTERLRAVERAEADAALSSEASVAAFRERVAATKRDLLSFLIQAKREGKRVVGYGAPAKGNTLLNYCGVREDFLDFTVDRSPHKQGRLLPGTHLRILGPEAIDREKPDYVLVLPWNLKEEIRAQLAHVRDWGGRLVVPVPALEVLS